MLRLHAQGTVSSNPTPLLKVKVRSKPILQVAGVHIEPAGVLGSISDSSRCGLCLIRFRRHMVVYVSLDSARQCSAYAVACI